MTRRIVSLLGCALAIGGWTAVPGLSQGALAGQGGRQRVLLRFVADSSVVGHYKFTARETHRLEFDIPDDDPRAALLQSATGPWERTTEVAATLVSVPRRLDEDRRYLIYWLGFRIKGGDGRSLNGLQWDSIFREVGRRAVLQMSPLGQPRGIEVTSDAVRPVGRALAGILSALALTLPEDSVTEGSSWKDEVLVPVRRADGTRQLATVDVTYRLRRLTVEPEGLMAHIEFDGEPVAAEAGADEVSGRYFGEGVFAVKEGRYERMMALAELEVKWADSGGLPPSRSLLDWRAQFNRN